MERADTIDQRTRQVLREVRSGLDDLYGSRLRGIYVYGSYARGEPQPGSDLDVLVVLTDVRDVGEELGRMSDLGSRLSLAHDVTISFLPVSQSEFATLESLLHEYGLGVSLTGMVESRCLG